MKSTLSVYLLLLILSAACSTTKNAVHQNKVLLTQEIDSVYNRKFFNGFGVAIVDENHILYEQGFGVSNRITGKKYGHHTLQNIASVSKTFVGIALLKAQELGKLKLDDPIQLYLPFSVVNPHFPEAKITIRHLATHTSSIIDNTYYLSKNYYLKPGQDIQGMQLVFDEEQILNPADSIIPLSSFLENMLTEHGQWNQNSFSSYSPGTMYEYSNTGTTLAAFIIEQATGQSFREFTQKYILDPLRMKDSGWGFSDIDFSCFSTLYADPETALPFYEMITYPDGGFITSVHDLGLYLSELIKGYNENGTLLTKESYREYFRPQLSAENFTERSENNPYNESYNTGIFIGFGYTGYIGHTGGDPGVLSMLFFDPRTKLGRIMIFNTSFSDQAGNNAFYDIWNILEKYQEKIR